MGLKHYNFLFTIILFSALAFSQEKGPVLLPVDEAEKDSSFYRFREMLLDAVNEKDLDFVISILDENIKNSFGLNNGIEEFKEMWEVNRHNSPLWKEMEFILNSGGAFSNNDASMFLAPYVYSSWIDTLDAFTNVAVIDSNVLLRKEPSLKSKAIDTLNYNILKYDFDSYNDENFLWAETYYGKEGYVLQDKVRSPIDYRIGFEKQGGVWKIVWFVAGD